jgi:cell division protein FtsZ
MIHFDLPKEKSSIIKVIGIGGGGSNAVNYMHSQGIEGVNFIICNTDAQAISHSKVPNKIQLGPHLTQGLGAGANPEIGRQATEESLEEIRRILEVNTKMAFITAGMGGGTGTGGAPIVARICKEMGILTVGIITTPFSYEGKKRIAQGEDGINRLKDHVDTLLVISNDKLRHQYGNLKMKEAFAKADNILATAAKCITDVINSTGQINVDFADVCTVMRNGGVAILGSGAAEGEGRAQHAIEQALNSPLLNDNDIRGAQWILININSSEGEHEFTMDEVDIIQNYLLSQAGPNSDVILGLGYDPSLGGKIGITLIATGFDHMNVPTEEKTVAARTPETPEKIVMTLGMEGEERKMYHQQAALFAEEAKEERDLMAPSLSEPEPPAEVQPVRTPIPHDATLTAEPARAIPSQEAARAAAQREFLSRPSHIYDEAEETLPTAAKADPSFPEEAPGFEMHLVIKEDTPKVEPVRVPPPTPPIQEVASNGDEVDEQRRKAADRLQKLRNLSFNVNAQDAGSEFEAIPAYMRRNMELYNTVNSIENFYSNYTVKPSDNNKVEISTINTFLEGKKPD